MRILNAGFERSNERNRAHEKEIHGDRIVIRVDRQVKTGKVETIELSYLEALKLISQLAEATWSAAE